MDFPDLLEMPDVPVKDQIEMLVDQLMQLRQASFQGLLDHQDDIDKTTLMIQDLARTQEDILHKIDCLESDMEKQDSTQLGQILCIAASSLATAFLGIAGVIAYNYF